MSYKNKEDQLASQRRWYSRNKERVIAENYARREGYVLQMTEYKASIGCQICGYNRTPRALDWHHLDPGTKAGGVSDLTRRSFARGLEESGKCVLLCRVCHVEVEEGLIDLSHSSNG